MVQVRCEHPRAKILEGMSPRKSAVLAHASTRDEGKARREASCKPLAEGTMAISARLSWTRCVRANGTVIHDGAADHPSTVLQSTAITLLVCTCACLSKIQAKSIRMVI